MQAIKEAALYKAPPDDSPSEFAHMRLTIEHLQAELAAERARSAEYREIIEAMTGKIEAIQTECDQRQKVMLGTLLTWMVHRVEETGK